MKHLSLALRAFFPSPGVADAPLCKYHPSCSEYASQALRKHGIVRGSLKAGWRLLRCNPWSHGGWDPVADRKLFRSAGSTHADHGHEPGAPA